MKTPSFAVLPWFFGAAAGAAMTLGMLGGRVGAQGQQAQDVPSGQPAASIDLMTKEGVDLVKGQWRYSDTKIIEVDYRRQDGTPCKTYDYEPKAGVADFDDSKWEVLDPTTLGRARSTGKICFNWYRIKVTIPPKVGDFDPTGSTVVFETTVDDYGEVWVNGQLPRRLKQVGGSIVAGFNAPNRLVVGRNVQPGQEITIAVFGINSPLSAAPGNWIFLRKPTALDFYKP